MYIFKFLFFPQCKLWSLTHRRCSVDICWFAEVKMKLRSGGGCQLVKSWLLFLHTQLPSDFVKTGIFVSLTCCWRFLLCCPLKLWALCKQVCKFVFHPQTFTECFLCTILWTHKVRAMSPLLSLRFQRCFFPRWP